METDYAQIIFGGVPEVKKLVVLEMKTKREEIGFTPEQLDALFRLSADWPLFQEIESNPDLLTNSYIQAALDNRTNDLFDLSKKYDNTSDVLFHLLSLEKRIAKWLEENPDEIQKAVEEFQKERKGQIRVTVWPKDLGKQAQKICNGEPVSWGGINSVTSKQWAITHILLSTMKQLG